MSAGTTKNVHQYTRQSQCLCAVPPRGYYTRGHWSQFLEPVTKEVTKGNTNDSLLLKQRMTVQNNQHQSHLTENKHMQSPLSHSPQQLVVNVHSAQVLDEVLVGGVRQIELGVVKR